MSRIGVGTTALLVTLVTLLAAAPQEEPDDPLGRWFQEHELWVAGTILRVQPARRRVLLEPEGSFFGRGWIEEGRDAREPAAGRLLVDLADAVGIAFFRDSEGNEEKVSLAAAWARIEVNQQIQVARWPGRRSNAVRLSGGGVGRGTGLEDVFRDRLAGPPAPARLTAMKITGAVRVRVIASSRNEGGAGEDEDGDEGPGDPPSRRPRERS